ncbi:hypothetical protein FHG87_024356 [Trinorchestia longiramus]|nr:hypothetical protein FHG87_024356 [Trinorchestia longiramus]
MPTLQEMNRNRKAESSSNPDSTTTTARDIVTKMDFEETDQPKGQLKQGNEELAAMRADGRTSAVTPHEDCNGFRDGGQSANRKHQVTSPSHINVTSSAQPYHNGHISCKDPASLGGGKFIVSEASAFALSFDKAVNGFLSDSIRTTPSAGSLAPSSSVVNSLGLSGTGHEGGAPDASLECLDNLPQHPRACDDRAQLARGDVVESGEQDLRFCSSNFHHKLSVNDAKLKENAGSKFGDIFHVNLGAETIAQLRNEHQINPINYSSLPLPSPPSGEENQQGLEHPLSGGNLLNSGGRNLQNTTSLTNELLSEDNATGFKNNSKNDSCMEAVLKVDGISAKNEGVQQLLQMVSQLQEEVQTLLQQKAELQLQLHQSKLLCTELNTQLQQMQHWHQPGIIAGRHAFAL